MGWQVRPCCHVASGCLNVAGLVLSRGTLAAQLVGLASPPEETHLTRLVVPGRAPPPMCGRVNLIFGTGQMENARRARLCVKVGTGLWVGVGGPHLRQKRGAGPAQSSGSWARASCAPGSGLFLFAAPQRVPGVARTTGREERGSPRVACDMGGSGRAETGDRFLLRNPPKILWTKSLGRVLSPAHPSGVSPGSRTGVAQETFPPSLAPGQLVPANRSPGLAVRLQLVES